MSREQLRQLRARRESLRRQTPELLKWVQRDRETLAKLIAQVNAQRERVARLEQLEASARTATAAAAVGAAAADLEDIESDIESDTRSAFSEARREQSLLAQQLEQIVEEIRQIKRTLSAQSAVRASDARAYVEARANAEALQTQDTRSVAADLQRYTELLRREARETEDMLDGVSSSLSDRSENLKTLEYERELVLEDQHELYSAWQSQEDALEDSLAEIESDGELLKKQSEALRDAIAFERNSIQRCDERDEEHDHGSVVRLFEMEAELYHVLSTMQTQQGQLARMHQRLVVMHEERRVIHGIAAQWLGDNEQNREAALVGVREATEAQQSVGAQLELVRAMLATTIMKASARTNDGVERPEVEMIDHISRIVGDDSVHEDPSKRVRRMWLGRDWKKRDTAELDAARKFRSEERHMRGKIARLQELQHQATKQLAMHNASLEDARQLALHKKNDDEVSFAHLAISLTLNRAKLDEQLSALQQQHDEAVERAQQLESWGVEVKTLESEISSFEKAGYSEEKREMEKENGSSDGTYVRSSPAASSPAARSLNESIPSQSVTQSIAGSQIRSPAQLSGREIEEPSTTSSPATFPPGSGSYALSFQNSTRKKKKKIPAWRKKKTNMEQNIQGYTAKQLSKLQQYVNYLQEGAVFRRQLQQHHDEERVRERWVQLSEDLSRLEVILPEPFETIGTPTGAGTRREAYYRLDTLSDVHAIRKRGAFSLYFVNSASNTQTFEIAKEHKSTDLDTWVTALSLLVFHTKQSGGLARVRVRLRKALLS